MRTLETPQFFYFDLGKVLLDFSHEKMCSQMASKVGLDPKQAYEFVFEHGLSQRYECGEIDSAQFCEAFFDLAEHRCEPEELLFAG